MIYQVVAFSDPSATDSSISGTFSYSSEGNDGMTYEITNGFFDTTINKQDRS